MKIKAKKSLGQNFLIDKEKLESISSFLDIKNKNIVEVWPGYWALSEKLLNKYPKNLELVELDRDMVDILEKRIEKGELINLKTNLSIKNIDILKYKPNFENYFVIANIPYYITSPILRHFFYNLENTPEKMLILMQKDVGDKIVEGVETSPLAPQKQTSPLTPLLKGEGKNKENNFNDSVSSTKWQKGFVDNTKRAPKKIKNSVLSLFLQKKSFISEVLFVGKECFSPSPKVDSSVLFFEKHNLYDYVDDKEFLEFIKLAFCEPRKKLAKNLSKKYKKEDILKIFEENSIPENSRAWDLNIAIYCKLILDFNKFLT